VYILEGVFVHVYIFVSYVEVTESDHDGGINSTAELSFWPSLEACREGHRESMAMHCCSLDPQFTLKSVS